MTSYAPCWMVLALALSGCGGTPDAPVPGRVDEGYYRCFYKGSTHVANIDFVIGPGDSFETFNTEAGYFQPGTYTFEGGVLSLTMPSDVLRFKPAADRGDHSGPFRLITKEGDRSPFLCTHTYGEAPSLEELKREGQ